MLGTTNEDENLIRLHKSSIAVRGRDAARVVTYPPSLFTCAQILSMIESTALKRFVAHTTDPNDDNLRSLELWVFNPDIFYSCSAYRDNSVLSIDVNGEVSVTTSLTNEETEARSASEPSAINAQQKSPSPAMTRSDRVDRKERSPYGDDMSQIYGDDLPQLPPTKNATAQIIEGEIHVEVPLRNVLSRKKNDPSTNGEAHIEDISETETPLVTAPQNVQESKSNGTNEAVAQLKPSEHVNLVHRASKIFYKPLSQQTSAPTFLDANSNTHEDLFFANPKDLVALHETLEKSTAMLPASARSFQDWNIGLLHRYESVPSGLGVMAENPLARGIKAKDGRVTRWDIGHGAEGLFA